MQKNLRISKKSSTFAAAFATKRFSESEPEGETIGAKAK